MSRLHWIKLPGPGRLAIAARPRADDWLEDEIAAWRGEGVDVVVSLLEPSEVHELGLQREAELCRSNGMEFISLPIPDRGLPESRHEVSQLARGLAAGLREGRAIAIHCRAGIGRSSMIAACVLVCLRIGATDAWALIEAARGVRVPDTEEQREWVIVFGKGSRADEEQ
jgi:protein-tyrosine phosphatase